MLMNPTEMSAEKTNGFSEQQWEEVEVPVPWGHISGKWWGSRTQQPILALHGWQDNAGSFDKLAPLLCEAGFSVYAIDTPGHGHSSHLPPGCTYYLLWDGVHTIRRITKHFAWQKITLLGHSMGAAISFLYAGVYPDDVGRFIAFDVASARIVDTPRLTQVAADCIDKLLKYEDPIFSKQIAYSYEDMIALVYEAHKGSLTRDSCEIMVKRGAKLAEDGEGFVFRRDPRLKVASFSTLSAEQSMGFASRIKCKVLNIRAIDGMKFDDYDATLDKIEETAEKLERHTVPGNHHVHLNDAEFVSDIVVDFLKS